MLTGFVRRFRWADSNTDVKVNVTRDTVLCFIP